MLIQLVYFLLLYFTAREGSHTANWSGITYSWGCGGGWGRDDCIIAQITSNIEVQKNLRLRDLVKSDTVVTNREGGT